MGVLSSMTLKGDKWPRLSTHLRNVWSTDLRRWTDLRRHSSSIQTAWVMRKFLPQDLCQVLIGSLFGMYSCLFWENSYHNDGYFNLFFHLPQVEFKHLSQIQHLTQSTVAAAAAAKLLQSCPTLCDPRDGSPPGSPVPGILQARTLEWVAISFSNAWKWKVKAKLLSPVWLSDPMDCSLPGSSIHGIFQARVLEWGAIAFSGPTC